MKKVLVTGASGHLGNNLALMLASRGYQVRASVRNHRDKKKIFYLQHPNIETCSLDLLDPPSITRAAVGVDCVFHVAAPQLRFSKKPQTDIINPILKGSENVIKACTAAGVANFVFSSTSSAAGCYTKDGDPVTETTWNHKTGSELTLAKIDAEKRVKWVAANAGIRFVSILMPQIIGPRCYRSTPNSALFEKLIRGRLPAVPTVGFHTVDVRDAAEAHILAYESKGASGRYIVAGHHFTAQELLEFLKSKSDEFDFKAPKYVLPSWLVPPLVLVDKLKSMLSGAPRTLNLSMARDIFNKDLRLSSQRAIDEMGWKARPFEETFADTLAWTKNYFIERQLPKESGLNSPVDYTVS